MDQIMVDDDITTITTLYVSNLDNSFPHEKVLEIFSKYGELESHECIFFQNYAFIRYLKREDAETAFSCLDKEKIGKHFITIKWSDSCDQRTSIHLTFNPKHAKIGFHKAIFHICRGFGKVNHYNIPRKKVGELSTSFYEGFGFVHFKDSQNGKEASIAAIKYFNENEVGGVKVNCSFSKKKLSASMNGSVVPQSLTSSSSSLNSSGNSINLYQQAPQQQQLSSSTSSTSSSFGSSPNNQTECKLSRFDQQLKELQNQKDQLTLKIQQQQQQIYQLNPQSLPFIYRGTLTNASINTNTVSNNNNNNNTNNNIPTISKNVHNMSNSTTPSHSPPITLDIPLFFGQSQQLQSEVNYNYNNVFVESTFNGMDQIVPNSFLPSTHQVQQQQQQQQPQQQQQSQTLSYSNNNTVHTKPLSKSNNSIDYLYRQQQQQSQEIPTNQPTTLNEIQEEQLAHFNVYTQLLNKQINQNNQMYTSNNLEIFQSPSQKFFWERCKLDEIVLPSTFSLDSSITTSESSSTVPSTSSSPTSSSTFTPMSSSPMKPIYPLSASTNSGLFNTIISPPNGTSSNNNNTLLTKSQPMVPTTSMMSSTQISPSPSPPPSLNHSANQFYQSMYTSSLSSSPSSSVMNNHHSPSNTNNIFLQIGAQTN